MISTAATVVVKKFNPESAPTVTADSVAPTAINAIEIYGPSLEIIRARKNELPLLPIKNQLARFLWAVRVVKEKRNGVRALLKAK